MSPQEEVVGALRKLGMKKSDAERKVRAAWGSGDYATAEDLFRAVFYAKEGTDGSQKTEVPNERRSGESEVRKTRRDHHRNGQDGDDIPVLRDVRPGILPVQHRPRPGVSRRGEIHTPPETGGAILRFCLTLIGLPLVVLAALLGATVRHGGKRVAKQLFHVPRRGH